MTLPELLAELKASGASLHLTPENKLSWRYVHPPSADLRAAVKAHREVLVAVLQAQAAEGPVLRPLSESMSRLVRAAQLTHLDRPAALPGGYVQNFSQYVLSWAATYATGVNIEHALKALGEAHGAWTAGQ